MSPLPRDRTLDSTLALLSDGYQFVAKRCRRYDTDVFQTRLMLRRAVCMMGEEAARVFYEPGRFTRRGALPPTALLLLQDRGSVALQDGAAHRQRKAMFMALMTPTAITGLANAMRDEWRAALARWTRTREVVLFDAVREVLTRAVCAWAGVPLSDAEATARTREFGAMIDGAGAVGPRNWRGLLLRVRTERWARGIIEQVRAGVRAVPPGSAAHVIAWHRELDGALLDTTVAAVELLNVLRPTVAVDRYVTFAALALHEHPECRARLERGDDGDGEDGDGEDGDGEDGEDGDERDPYLEWFVQEVRRFYPFFPVVGGRVLQAFDWRGHHFAEGTWVLLDLYGTLHDDRTWEAPEAFRPERFRGRGVSAFDLIPQGGGDHRVTHRCAGEWITIALMKRAVRLLTTAMRYDVPAQDLRISLSRMPAVPKSRVVLTNVRPREGAGRPG